MSARERAAWHRLAQAAEATALALFFGLSRLLPIDWASAIGGAVARGIGPRLRVSDRARRNVRRALPELDTAACERVIRGMWDNLGRVAAELPHLEHFGTAVRDGRLEVVGTQHVNALRDAITGVIWFSAHCANWELLAPLAGQLGVPLTLVYRTANNPWVDALVQRFRRRTGSALRYLPKGAQAARGILISIGRHEHLAMLVDQKMNDGVAVPFFGRDAMTAPAIARFGLHYGCPLLPVRVERLEGARFRITLQPPLVVVPSGDPEHDVLDLMTRINGLIESWIRERPEQWLWLHNRWPD
jgi:KDO2-lipid IV(A) lauroyltransferase